MPQGRAVTQDNQPLLARDGKTCCYFVDEAGDGTLFDRRGRVIVGQPGCSRYFILGLAELGSPEVLADELNALRAKLLADLYFKGVPSMQPGRRKTALAFHAKDDLPEVRREVYSVLVRHPIRFFAVVKHKDAVLGYVRSRNASEPRYRYHANELYDLLVRRLFRDRLHDASAYCITFARRWGSDRTAALRAAIDVARQRFEEKFGVARCSSISVVASTPAQSAGLQAVDYLLRGLQRLYERGEDRYWQFTWPLVRLVVDVDDKRRHGYGEYFTQKNPLSLASVKREPEI
ncbi:MAG: DUF3800 domain-containing protein [candidate division WOR-3 bacterium]|nr:MAG: DUF3800 domain-containing protein [candidate division WOR-3 bacterium]